MITEAREMKELRRDKGDSRFNGVGFICMS